MYVCMYVLQFSPAGSVCTRFCTCMTQISAAHDLSVCLSVCLTHADVQDGTMVLYSFLTLKSLGEIPIQSHPTPAPNTRIGRENMIFMILGDTVDWRAFKSWRDGQRNLAHGTETKKIRKNKNKPSSSEETIQEIVRDQQLAISRKYKTEDHNRR